MSSFPIETLKELIAEYLETLDDEEIIDDLNTLRGYAAYDLEKFITWLEDVKQVNLNKLGGVND